MLMSNLTWTRAKVQPEGEREREQSEDGEREGERREGSSITDNHDANGNKMVLLTCPPP